MDIEHDDEGGCGVGNCGDYVEILGQRYCGTSQPEPIISCNDLKLTFKSDYISEPKNYTPVVQWFGGFRAVWTEIPDDR